MDNEYVVERTTNVEVLSGFSHAGWQWSVWDFPGQVEYASTNSLFVQQDKCVFLLCVSLDAALRPEQCEASLARWLTMLSSRRADRDKPRVMVIGTHSDRSNSGNMSWFASLKAQLPVELSRLHFIADPLAADVGNPRNLEPILNALTATGASLVWEQPQSLFELQSRLPAWFDQQLIVRQPTLHVKLREFRIKLKQLFLEAVGAVIALPHLRAVVVNIQAFAKLLGAVVSPEGKEHGGLPAVFGVVQRRDLLLHLDSCSKRLGVQVKAEELLQIVCDLELAFPAAECKRAVECSAYLIPSRVGEAERRDGNGADRVSARNAWFGEHPVSCCVRVRRALDFKAAEAAAVPAKWHSVLPLGFFVSLLTSACRLDAGRNSLRCRPGMFTLSLHLRNQPAWHACVWLSPDDSYLDVYVSSESAEGAAVCMRQMLAQLDATLQQPRWSSLRTERVVLCPLCSFTAPDGMSRRCPERQYEAARALSQSDEYVQCTVHNKRVATSMAFGTLPDSTGLRITTIISDSPAEDSTSWLTDHCLELKQLAGFDMSRPVANGEFGKVFRASLMLDDSKSVAVAVKRGLHALMNDVYMH